MEPGKIGIITKDFFEERDEKWLYLSTIVDVTSYWSSLYPKRVKNRKFFELRYRLIEQSTPFTCTVIYLGDTVKPDTIISEGADHKMSKENTDGWKYHKVLLTIDEHSEVRYLHENCLDYFTWYDK